MGVKNYCAKETCDSGLVLAGVVLQGWGNDGLLKRPRMLADYLRRPSLETARLGLMLGLAC
jgi:hypothetical protein